MQTSAIRHRVADFLRQHPPFSAIDDTDLLPLVSQGRVKFHEKDEFLCWQNAAYGPHLLVIQQGSVSLWEDSGGTETLRDIRGPGDIVGVERFLGGSEYPYSAKSNSDVLVYALPAAAFAPLLEKNPAVLRYVEGHAASGAIYREGSRRGVHQQYLVEHVPHPAPVSCAADASVAEVARLLRQRGVDTIAVMEGTEILGTVGAQELIAWIAGGAPTECTARALMTSPPPTAGPQTTVAECVLAMGHAHRSHVALTSDGTARGGLLHLVSSADLQPAFGDHPVLVLDQIAKAADLEALRLLHLRARALLQAHLDGPASVDWTAAFAHRINVAVVERWTELDGSSGSGRAWCFWDAAGRHELSTAALPNVLLLCEDSADAAAGQATLERLRRDLVFCGYLNHPGAAGFCGTLESWRERFTDWIADPIQSQMDQALPLFDLSPATGAIALGQSLIASVHEALAARPLFQMMLANDCLATLPPLTFFEDVVIGEDGERSGVFAIAERALHPIVEVGRVFAIGSSTPAASTLDRLADARAQLPAHEAIFRHAADTFRVLLYLQARTGLRTQGVGDEILPTHLSRQDRQALKTGFRAIHRLLEFTMAHFWKAQP